MEDDNTICNMVDIGGDLDVGKTTMRILHKTGKW